jgi:hypothetical protein
MSDIYRQCSQVGIWLGCVPREYGLEQGLRRVDNMLEDLSLQLDPFGMIRHFVER